MSATKPTELPVQQPTKYELVVNLKTAKALASPCSRTGAFGRDCSNWRKREADAEDAAR